MFYTKHTSWSAKPGKGRIGKTSPGFPQRDSTDQLDLGFFKRLFTPKDEQAFVDGLKAFVQGNETAALDSFVTTLHLPDAGFMAGFIAYKHEDYRHALTCFEHAYQRQDGLGKHFAKYGLDLVLTLPVTDELDAHVRPRRRGLLLGMVEVLQELGEHFRAAELLMELRSLDPEDVLVKASLVELLFDARPDDPMSPKCTTKSRVTVFFEQELNTVRHLAGSRYMTTEEICRMIGKIDNPVPRQPPLTTGQKF